MTNPIEDDLARAQLELKRAYLLLEAGEADLAAESAERAVSIAPDHPIPTIIRGAILCAMGNSRGALGALRAARKRWPSEALAHVHFAEACFFAGRDTRGVSALSDARSCPNSTAHAALIDSMEGFWREAGRIDSQGDTT